MCTKNHDHMKYGFWDTNWDIFFCHFGPFLPFYPSNNLENQNLTKMKKASGDVIIYTCVPKITILWCMLPEIWSATDTLLCQFGPGDIILLHMCTINEPFDPSNNPTNQNFEKNGKNTLRYYHFTLVCHKWQSHDVWFLTYRAWQTNFFVISGNFCPFAPLTTHKIKILKNWKKIHGDIII